MELENILGKNGADSTGKLRIIQEIVPGKQISLVHIIAGPDDIVYKKLGLNPEVDYKRSAIGIISITPPEMAIIAGDLANKTANIDLGFIDRFSGTLIFTGKVSEVQAAIDSICNYFKTVHGFEIAPLTKT